MSKSVDISDIKPERIFDKNGNPTDIEYFRKLMMNGIRSAVPTQIQLGPTTFGKNFIVQYQLSKETGDGRLWDLRVFFREVNGKPMAKKLGTFCASFVQHYFDPLKGREEGRAIDVMFGPALQIRWQWDLLMRNIPGRAIEMIHDMFFKLLVENFGN